MTCISGAVSGCHAIFSSFFMHSLFYYFTSSEDMSATSEEILGWSAKQGSILVGGGLLNERQLPGRDFDDEELPHFLLRHNLCQEIFHQWALRDLRGGLAGAWSRPLFSGGWQESTDKDTLAFNLQSPSLFVDIRIPVDRPQSLMRKKSLADCSFADLRYLARQHCFSGYSLPSEDGVVYTRHHAIDWNYHPSFPRSRPNKWRAEMNKDNLMSFKEFSTTLDINQIPVYMERWQRFSGDQMGEKYFAAYRKGKLPSQGFSETDRVFRKAVLVLVGGHFAFALDRPYIPDFKGAPGPGGPALIDYAAKIGDRRSAEAYLDLEGSYGQTNFNKCGRSGSNLKIVKSTHPWREGKKLFDRDDAEGGVTLTITSSQGTTLLSDVPEAMCLSLQWGGYEWTVFENSYSLAELRNMFGMEGVVQSASNSIVKSVRSRL